MSGSCTRCGASTPPDAGYCAMCGAPTDQAIELIELVRDEPAPVVADDVVGREPGRGGRWLVLALGALAALGLGTWALGDGDDAEPERAGPTTTRPSTITVTTARPRPPTTRPPRTTTTLPPGPVLGEPVGAVLVGTGHDGRLAALDLDTGELRRGELRIQGAVVHQGTPVVGDDCGSWSVLDPETLMPGAQLTPCGWGYDTGPGGLDAFMRFDDFGRSIRIGDVENLVEVELAADMPGYPVYVDGTRLLWRVPGAGLVWRDAVSGVSEPWVDGDLLAAAGDFLVWQACDAELRCGAWIGRPDDPRWREVDIDVSPFGQQAVVSPDGEQVLVTSYGPTSQVGLIATATGARTTLDRAIEPWPTIEWLPGGRWLIARDYSAGRPRLVALSVDGSTDIELPFASLEGFAVVVPKS